MTSNLLFKVSRIFVRSAEVSLSVPAIISSSARTWNLSILSWHAAIEDVVDVDKEHAISSRSDLIEEVKRSISFLCKARRDRPMLTLKSSPGDFCTKDVYFSNAAHRPVAQEASVANGSSLESVCVAVCMPST